ncbi:TerD family protein [Lentzea tibetensis]|uniref:TerD family protein n=1 Tax=Lentzea tibetensis TaxID=2591470 RepID=UPI001644138F|nr:TerD family protein [Lentzea tibetensis]
MLVPLLIQKTLRVPLSTAEQGEGSTVARQVDVVLMSTGFACSPELLRHLSGLRPLGAINAGLQILDAVRGLVGDHVQHNPYFRDFPAGVPDTFDFWLECLRLAAGDVFLQVYGRAQHSYEDMLARRGELLASTKDKIKVLQLGGTLDEEARAHYLTLAASPIPLEESDRDLLGLLAVWCADAPQPSAIPVRENRALINRVRLAHGRPLLVDTVTDVLRLACAVSGGDVTLEEPTKFGTFARRDRRALLGALHDVVSAQPAKLADVARFGERWKRLGERLHPHEYPKYPGAAEVFAVARGDRRVPTLAARVEAAYADGDVVAVTKLLTTAPGMLLRGLDRLMSTATEDEAAHVVDAVRAVAGRVSGRVLLSVREHLQNRAAPGWRRLFVNRNGRGVVVRDTRPPLSVSAVLSVVDDEIRSRMPAVGSLEVDPDVLSIAVPLSDKTSSGGFGVLPRGSVVPVSGDLVRFFTYWKERGERTDYDLSVLLLDDTFQYDGQVSWTNLSGNGATHSGDFVEAPDGASEFIDLNLAEVTARYVVPQVNVFCGEKFDEVEESFFGFMDRDLLRGGKPFEPRTVRAKSDLRGRGRVALPLVFARDDDGSWSAKWLHLYLGGSPGFNRVETNAVTTSDLAASVVRREYLTMRYLVDMVRTTGEGPALRVDLTNFGTLVPD